MHGNQRPAPRTAATRHAKAARAARTKAASRAATGIAATASATATATATARGRRQRRRRRRRRSPRASAAAAYQPAAAAARFPELLADRPQAHAGAQAAGDGGNAQPARRRGAHAQAGRHLRAAEGAVPPSERRRRRRRAGNPARRLRLPAQRRRQLPGRPGRRLHLAQPDPPLQPAHRRRNLRPHPQPEGRRALRRAERARHAQRRAAGSVQGQGAVREPDPAVPAQALHAGARQRLDRKTSPAASWI